MATEEIREAARSIIFACGIGGYGPELGDNHPLVVRSIAAVQVAADAYAAEQVAAYREAAEAMARGGGGVMQVPEALRLATVADYTPTPHEMAGAAYVLAKEVERLKSLVDRFREYAAGQMCDCYDEYGKRLPKPCERCRLLYGHETWKEFENAAIERGDDA